RTLGFARDLGAVARELARRRDLHELCDARAAVSRDGSFSDDGAVWRAGQLSDFFADTCDADRDYGSSDWDGGGSGQSAATVRHWVGGTAGGFGDYGAAGLDWDQNCAPHSAAAWGHCFWRSTVGEMVDSLAAAGHSSRRRNLNESGVHGGVG